MKIELQRTKHGIEFIQNELHQEPIYIGSRHKYFTSESEAIESFLHYQRVVLTSYSRDCPGRRFVREAVSRWSAALAEVENP